MLSKPLQPKSHLECSFGNIEMSTVQDNALGVVKYKHVDDSAAAESHGAQIRAQGEIIAERTYATRELVLCPREEFIISAI